MNTFTSFCIAACLFMCFVGMAGTLVSSLGVFPASVRTGDNIYNGTSTDIFGHLTQNITSSTPAAFSFDSLWIVGTGLGIGIIAAILTKSTNMIAVWLFGSIFWSGWLNLVGIINSGGFLDFTTGLILVSMITVGMLIIFAGAVIGMLSGSIWMR